MKTEPPPVPPEPGRGPRVMLWLAAPLALVVAAFVIKVAVMLNNASNGWDTYAAEEFPQAQAAYAGNAKGNVFQPWVASYDEGTARLRLQDFSGSIELLDRALAKAPAVEECRVRINLALAHEELGDGLVGGEDPEAPRRSWQTARDVLADGNCAVDSPGGEEQTEAAKTTDDRLAQKLNPPSAEPSPSESPSGSPSPSPSPGQQQQEQKEAERKEKQLEERNQEGERRQQENRDWREGNLSPFGETW